MPLQASLPEAAVSLNPLLFRFSFALIGSLLALISALLVDVDFGHEPAEILGVVGTSGRDWGV